MTSIRKLSSKGRLTAKEKVKTEQSASIDESSGDKVALEKNTLLNRRILLVEDNRINQSIILGVLGSLYLTADIVEDGLAALQRLKESQARYQLILMDCFLPKLDGFQTTKLIRQGEVGQHYQAIPIIAITANVKQSDKEKCLAFGMNDFVSKPIKIKRLEKIIYHWLEVNEESLSRVESTVTAINNTLDSSTDTQKSNIYSEFWRQDEFIKRARNDIQLAKKLVVLFIDDAPVLLSQLIDSMADGKTDEIVSYVHKLKGSARDLGAFKLGQICQKIENNPRCNEKQQLSLYIKTLSKEFDLLMKALQCFIDD
ncbi:response regulator [Thalassotalea castellviae]|uniref:Response regulator n=1 Tax=Thalassotalea castellviae TaxID=3075612 RepID=A0ABU2ZW41_9GAMM|nr:response regulator [Thalassotalea sp. W431]MDT0602151.1 response regulator [Thalassotalea sp. W431]